VRTVKERRIGELPTAPLIVSGTPSVSRRKFEPQLGPEVKDQPVANVDLATEGAMLARRATSWLLARRTTVDPKEEPVRRGQAWQWQAERAAGRRKA